MNNTKPPNDTPSAQQWAQTNAYCRRIGMSQADIWAMIGQTPNGRTNEQIADQAKSWIKNR